MQSKLTEVTYDIYVQPGEDFFLPKDLAKKLGPGHWQVSIRPIEENSEDKGVRLHGAFLNSYSPEDEGLYDDYPSG